jgi:hypothetical protein
VDALKGTQLRSATALGEIIIKTRINLSNDKHKSLFCRSVSDEERVLLDGHLADDKLHLVQVNQLGDGHVSFCGLKKQKRGSVTLKSQLCQNHLD